MALHILFRLGSDTGVADAAGGKYRFGIRDIPQRGRTLRKVIAEERERWQQLLDEAEAAEARALARAEELDGKAKEALKSAAQATHEAIQTAKLADGGLVLVERVVKAIRAATEARKLERLIQKAIEAKRKAEELEARYQAWLADMAWEDDDEEALTLLLN